MSVLAGLLPILNRIDALIAKIDELLTAMGVVIPPDGVIVPPTQIILEELNNRYYIFDSIDTSDTDERALGLKDILKTQGVEFARYVVILSVGGGFTYKLNTVGEPSLTAAVGAEHIFEVEEIYVAGSGGAGTAVMFIEYKVD